jgi:L-alanine-DL-glutamate epimerase-like enolase superfamily enzyme
MKITRVEAIPLKLPLKKPMLMGGRRYEWAETVLVRLETTGRLAGWGEAPVAPILSGETVASILAAIPILAEQIIGSDPRNLVSLSKRFRRAIYGNTAAKAAIDIALYDVVGRQIGWPVHRLLGGAAVDRLDCLWLVGNSDPVRDLAETEIMAKDGFRCFKLKVANGDLDEEAHTLSAMRSQFGNKILLCADANTNWSVAEAIRFVRLVAQASPDFLEQPVASDDLDGLRRVARASRVPIGADESLHDLTGMRHMIESGAAMGGSFKIMKFEGIAQCFSVIQLCRALGGEVNLSGKLGETSVANAATLALAAAIGQPSWGLSLTNHYLSDDVVRNPIAISEGSIRPLDEPGLGIVMSESKIANFESWPSPRVQEDLKTAGAFSPTP